MDGKTALAQYLVHFTTAENKIEQYVNERAFKKDITIKPVYVTHEEAEQETSLLNTSKMMEQGYNRNVKNRRKKTKFNFIINYAIYWMIMQYELLKIVTILATNINILNLEPIKNLRWSFL